MEEETRDKRSFPELEIRDDLEKVSDGVVDFLDKRYPISMNFLKNVFRWEGTKR